MDREKLTRKNKITAMNSQRTEKTVIYWKLTSQITTIKLQFLDNPT